MKSAHLAAKGVLNLLKEQMVLFKIVQTVLCTQRSQIFKTPVNFGKANVFHFSPSDRRIQMETDLQHRWNSNGGAKPKPSVRNLYRCHFIQHKSHTD